MEMVYAIFAFISIIHIKAMFSFVENEVLREILVASSCAGFGVLIYLLINRLMDNPFKNYMLKKEKEIQEKDRQLQMTEEELHRKWIQMENEFNKRTKEMFKNYDKMIEKYMNKLKKDK